MLRMWTTLWNAFYYEKTGQMKRKMMLNSDPQDPVQRSAYMMNVVYVAGATMNCVLGEECCDVWLCMQRSLVSFDVSLIVMSVTPKCWGVHIDDRYGFC
jgi:hypothetical protein